MQQQQVRQQQSLSIRRREAPAPPAAATGQPSAFQPCKCAPASDHSQQHTPASPVRRETSAARAATRRPGARRGACSGTGTLLQTRWVVAVQAAGRPAHARLNILVLWVGSPLAPPAAPSRLTNVIEARWMAADAATLRRPLPRCAPPVQDGRAAHGSHGYLTCATERETGVQCLITVQHAVLWSFTAAGWAPPPALPLAQVPRQPPT